MAVPNRWLVREALRASHHVQIEVEQGLPPAGGEPRGSVVRVFRGPLAVGAGVRIAIDARRAGEEPPPSGTLWDSVDAIARARVIEAWADEDVDGRLRVVGSQSTCLEAPSATPHPSPTRSGFRCGRGARGSLSSACSAAAVARRRRSRRG